MGENIKMLSIKEVADILNVSQKTIRRHIGSGKIASVKLGGIHRISSHEISALLGAGQPSSLLPIDEFPFSPNIPRGPLEKKWEK